MPGRTDTSNRPDGPVDRPVDSSRMSTDTFSAGLPSSSNTWPVMREPSACAHAGRQKRIKTDNAAVNGFISGKVWQTIPKISVIKTGLQTSYLDMSVQPEKLLYFLYYNPIEKLNVIKLLVIGFNGEYTNPACGRQLLFIQNLNKAGLPGCTQAS